MIDFNSSGSNLSNSKLGVLPGGLDVTNPAVVAARVSALKYRVEALEEAIRWLKIMAVTLAILAMTVAGAVIVGRVKIVYVQPVAEAAPAMHEIQGRAMLGAANHLLKPRTLGAASATLLIHEGGSAA